MSLESEDWRWKLRLFVSADLVGSTAHKASFPNKTYEWVSTFTEFFETFPNELERSYESLPDSKHGTTPEVRLKPWKFLGDEILFCVELKKYQDAAFHILALKRTLKSFPTAWREKKIPLGLKGCAWLAGFPVSNREISLPGPSGEQIVDFIGPSLDLGFRLTKFSDEFRLIVSADLAMVLLDAVDSTEWDKGLFHLVLMKREALKGVIRGEPYPVIYIHMNDGNHNLEEKLLGLKHENNWAQLKDFLRAFIDDRSPRLCRPFIHGDNHEKYGDIPAAFIVDREALYHEEQARGYKEQATQEAPPPTAAPIEPDLPEAIVAPNGVGSDT